MERIIAPSEFIINSDGSSFHLHVKPQQLSDKIIMMGDPERVTLTASFFDTIECDIRSREFHTITGIYKGKRITALSHGIGPDNIDIVMTELDAMANIDFDTRIEKKTFNQLSIVRVGTSGSLQPNYPTGSYIVSKRSIGFDGVLNYYEGRNNIVDHDFETALISATHWSNLHCRPYVVNADESLVNQIGFDMPKGTTISAIGFYGPQGRYVRLPLAQPNLNSEIENFRYKNETISNYEMESAPLAGLSKLMGHKAMTICCVINNRFLKDSNPNYKNSIEILIKTVLDRI